MDFLTIVMWFVIIGAAFTFGGAILSIVFSIIVWVIVCIGLLISAGINKLRGKS